MELAERTARRLDASGAQVVVLARAGQDLGRYGLSWSHMGFAYRDTPGKETFTPGELQDKGVDQIPSKKMLPLIDNGVARAVLQGNEATASDMLYSKRLRTIADRAKKLIQDANKLEPQLLTQANTSARFTFFM
jgi:hypothetical protein